MKRPRFRDRVGHALAGMIGPPLLRALARTLRIARRGEPDRSARARTARPVLYAVWHGRVIPFVATHGGRGIVGLVSEHRDGEYIARILRPLGFGVVRGSTTRGGTRALFDMAQRAREGHDIAITPDGPRGPRRDVRSGVIALAQRAGTPIVPVGVAARGFVFPTWDRFVVPRPWGRVAVVYGEPLVAPERETDLDACREELAARIERATEEADRLVNRTPARGFWVATYRVLTHALHALASPLVLAQRALRRGALARRLTLAGDLPRRVIWVHAASVGEMLGVRPLLAAMRSAWPGAPIVVSTMTRTGLALAREPATHADAAFLMPPDLPRAVRAIYDALDPRALVLVETELWPNLLIEAHERGVPVAIVNARLSPKGFPRYRAGRPLFGEVLRSVGWIAAQTEGDRERFLALGAAPERVEVLGSTKDDARSEGASREEVRRSLGLAPEALVILFGSARAAEMPVFAAATRELLARFSSLRILYAPRHLDRVGEIVRTLGLACAADGSSAPGGAREANDDALEAASGASDPGARGVTTLTAWRRGERDYRAMVIDTIGELRALYAAADVAVVGGSFSTHGGHNPLEPAVAGVPIVMGPSREHVRDAFARLEAAGGAEAASDGEDLVRRVARLLGDASERARRARALRQATASEPSVARTIVARLAARGIITPDPAAAAISTQSDDREPAHESVLAAGGRLPPSGATGRRRPAVRARPAEPEPAPAPALTTSTARLRRFAADLLYRDDASPGLATVRALLIPASWVVGAAALARRSAYEHGLARSSRAPLPTIAVGNLSLGGTGKTPFVIWLAERIASMGVRPGILTRGYGSALGGASRRVGGDDPREADEALLLARRLPEAIVVAGRDRRLSARLAMDAGAQALVLDDAFQHLALARDLDILLIDPRVPPGRGRVLPAGPLREPWAAAARADLFVVVDDDTAGEVTPERATASQSAQAAETPEPGRARANGFGKPVVRAARRPSALRRAGSIAEPSAAITGARVHLLSGIARPAGFRALAERLGARVAGETRHPDHHRFSAADLERAAAAAQRAGAEIILTTEKDAARLPEAFLARADVAVLEITLAITEGEEMLLREVRRVLAGGNDARE